MQRSCYKRVNISDSFIIVTTNFLLYRLIEVYMINVKTSFKNYILNDGLQSSIDSDVFLAYELLLVSIYILCTF